MHSFGQVAGFGQIGFRTAVLPRLYHRTGHIKIGRRIVREHAHGNFEHFVELLTARLVGLRHQKHLFQRKLLRLGVKQGLGLFH